MIDKEPEYQLLDEGEMRTDGVLLVKAIFSLVCPETGNTTFHLTDELNNMKPSVSENDLIKFHKAFRNLVRESGQ